MNKEKFTWGQNWIVSIIRRIFLLTSFYLVLTLFIDGSIFGGIYPIVVVGIAVVSIAILCKLIFHFVSGRKKTKARRDYEKFRIL